MPFVKHKIILFVAVLAFFVMMGVQSSRITPAQFAKQNERTQLQAEFEAQSNALKAFQAHISAAAPQELDAVFDNDSEKFRWQMISYLRARASAAGIDNLTIRIIQNPQGASRTAGLLDIPPDIAEKTFYDVRGESVYPTIKAWIDSLRGLPMAVGRLRLNAEGGFSASIVAWRVQSHV